MTKEEFEQLPVFYQYMLADRAGLKKDRRRRNKDIQQIIDKTRAQTKGYTGEEAPEYFYAPGRNLYQEIINKTNQP